MICPKYKAAILTDVDADSDSYSRLKEGDAQCDYQECAWWNEKRKCCGMLPFDTRVVK